MAMKIPENTLPIRDVLDTDYVRVVGQDGKSYRVPKSGFGEDVTEELNNKADIIITSASGSIAHIEDAGAYKPVEFTVYIEPVQGGSGDPSPENVRPITGWTGTTVTRTNALILHLEKGTRLGVTSGSETADENRSCTDYIPVDFTVNSNYYLSGMVNTLRSFVCAYNSSKQFLGRCSATERSYFSMSSTSFPNGTAQGTGAIAYIRVTEYVNSAGQNINSIDNAHLQLEPGTSSTAVTYPVSWQTEAGTVYKGSLDLITGELKTYPYYASYNGETLTGHWISSMDVYAEGTSPSIGAQVVNDGAEPTVYNLTPPEIFTLLKGVNNIWNNVGNTAAVYKADTKLFIEKAIAEAVAAL